MSLNPFLSKNLLVSLLVLTLVGCSVRSLHNRSYVSGSLQDRTGLDLRSDDQDQSFKLPESVSLSDGLSEDEAVATALWNNAQFQADLVQLGFARADLIEAGLIRNPVFSLLFPWGPKQLEFTLNFPLEFFWQRPQRVKSARLNAEIVADNLIQHGLDLVRRVRIAYAELVLAREQALIKQEEASLKSEIADIASARLKAGDISGLEETAFLLESARTKEAAIRFARDAHQAEFGLKALLGMELGGMALHLTDTHNSFVLEEDVSVLLEGAFAARPDIRAAEIAIEAAGHQVGWERSKILNFTAMLDANEQGKEGFEMGPGMQIELPLLNMNNGKIARAKAELDRATKQYLSVKQRIAGDVLESYTNYKAAQKALQILSEDVLPAAQKAAVNAGEAFETGEISYLETLDFKRQLLEARLQKTIAEAAVWQAGINLKFSTGYTMDSQTGGGTYE